MLNPVPDPIKQFKKMMSARLKIAKTVFMAGARRTIPEQQILKQLKRINEKIERLPKR